MQTDSHRILNPEELDGFTFKSKLVFSDIPLYRKVVKKIAKLLKKGELTRQQLWLASYYRKEIQESFVPKVSIRWVSNVIGWGVFAEQNFQKGDFVAEYTGIVRKSRPRADRKNAYCFEYPLTPGIPSSYTIDAEKQSGIARFINHATTSHQNLDCAIATLDGVNHIVLFAKEPIAKGTQLAYDYGPAYWSKREKPVDL